MMREELPPSCKGVSYYDDDHPMAGGMPPSCEGDDYDEDEEYSGSYGLPFLSVGEDSGEEEACFSFPVRTGPLPASLFKGQPNVIAYRKSLFDREKMLGNICASAVLEFPMGVFPLEESDVQALSGTVKAEVKSDFASAVCTAVVHTGLCGALCSTKSASAAVAGAAESGNSGSETLLGGLVGNVAVSETAGKVKFPRAGDTVYFHGVAFQAEVGDHAEVLRSGDFVSEFVPDGDRVEVGPEPVSRFAEPGPRLIDKPVPSVQSSVVPSLGHEPPGFDVLSLLDLGALGRDPGELLVPMPGFEFVGSLQSAVDERDNPEDVAIYQGRWSDTWPFEFEGAGFPVLREHKGSPGAIESAVSRSFLMEDRPLVAVIVKYLAGIGFHPGGMEELLFRLCGKQALRLLVLAGVSDFLAAAGVDVPSVLRERVLVGTGVFFGGGEAASGTYVHPLSGWTHLAFLEPVLAKAVSRSREGVGGLAYVRRLRLCVPNDVLVETLRSLDLLLGSRGRFLYVEYSFAVHWMVTGEHAPAFSVLPPDVDLSGGDVFELLVAEAFMRSVGFARTVKCAACSAVVAGVECERFVV